MDGFKKSAVYDRAIKLLSKQDYSEFKLKEKLENLGLDSNEISKAIKKLKDQNLLNEERLKKNLIKKLIYKGFSPEFIQNKLELDGMPVEIEEISSIYDEESINRKDQIKILIYKKLPRGIKSFENENEKRNALNKVMNFILSKGHDYEEALEYLESLD